MFKLLLSSIITLSILTEYPNSNIIILVFSLEVLITFLTPLVMERADSIGVVTVVSIFSGDAPGYVVNTTTYGKSMLGNRSVFIFINEITPSIITKITDTKIVNGLLTLNFDNIFPPLCITSKHYKTLAYKLYHQ